MIRNMSLILLSFIVFLPNSWSGPLEHCLKLARDYGRAPLEKMCSKVIKDNSCANCTRQWQDIHYYGQQNIIFLEKPQKDEVIAGHRAQVENILALRLSSDGEKLVTLSDDGEIKVYRTAITGNVGPMRNLLKEENFGAIDVDMGPSYMYVLNGKERSLYLYSEKANSSAQEKYQKDGVVKVFQNLPSGLKSMAIDHGKKNAYFLAEKGLFQFNLKDQTLQLIDQSEGPKNLDNLIYDQGLKGWDSSENKLIPLSPSP